MHLAWTQISELAGGTLRAQTGSQGAAAEGDVIAPAVSGALRAHATSASTERRRMADRDGSGALQVGRDTKAIHELRVSLVHAEEQLRPSTARRERELLACCSKWQHSTEAARGSPVGRLQLSEGAPLTPESRTASFSDITGVLLSVDAAAERGNSHSLLHRLGVVAAEAEIPVSQAFQAQQQ